VERETRGVRTALSRPDDIVPLRHDRGMADELQLRPPREDDLAIVEMLTQDPETTGE